MRSFLVLMITVLLFACDEKRVYEKNHDFEKQYWLVDEKPSFEFEIKDDQQSYNLYCNIRNGVAYPYSRLFLTYHLLDSAGKPLQKKLVDHMLFDPKNGEPEGRSGLGDLYDHQVPLITNYRFDYAGKYTIQVEQYMRMDTLKDVLAVGVRIEKAVEE